VFTKGSGHLLSIKALITIALAGLFVSAFTPAHATPVVHEVMLDPSHPGDKSRITFTASDRQYTLLLQPGTAVKPEQIEKAVLEDTHLEKLAFFSGTVSGDPTSWVRLTVADETITGHFKTEGVLYEITATSGTASEPGMVKFATASVEKMLNRYSLHSTIPGMGFEAGADTLRQPPEPDYDQMPTRTLFQAANNDVHTSIRIGLVIDSLFNEHHDQQGQAKALSIINTVDGIYQDQLGVAVLLESLVFYDDPAEDPMRNVEGTIDDILTTFRDVRMNESGLSPDLTMVHLLTGLKDPDNVIGLGWIGTACRLDGYDVSVSAPFAFDGLLAAHEMAHNLGALHDNQTSCPGENHDIMWPTLSSQTHATFSACSKQAMVAGISAACNLDNIDMSIGLAATATENELEFRLSVMVTNTDTVRDANGVNTRIRLPPGAVVKFHDSRCADNGEGIHCLHGHVEAESTDVIKMLVTYPDQIEQLIVANILPSGYTDVDTLNNRATIQTSPATIDDGDINFEPEPIAIPSNDPKSASGGSGALFVLLPVLILFGFRQLQCWPIRTKQVRQIVLSERGIDQESRLTA